jgi:outer membrane protein assembly factor BamB
MLCVEACMLMVQGPNGDEMPLRYRVEGWIGRVIRPRPTGVTFTGTFTATDVTPTLAAGQKVDGDGSGNALVDWPMLGGTPQRNMASPGAKNIPAEWSVEEGKQKNVKWMAELGTKSYGGPIIGDGKVFFGTNNGNPRDKKVQGKPAVLMCFNEADGKFLWQAVHEGPPDPLFDQSRGYGLLSSPCVEGKRHYYVTPGAVVICADNNTGKTVWSYDLMEKDKVVPYHCANCSPLIVDDLVMVVTGNGSDDQGKIASPKAPSFIALHKDTGKPAWKNNLPGDNIIEGQWSNPAVAVVGGKKQVIFPGGDCWLYSFETTSGKLIWKCNCNPLRAGKDKDYTPYIVATPVVYNGRCYVGLGAGPDLPVESAVRFGYLLCIDVNKTGDVSPKSFDAKDSANKDSALAWAFGGPIIPPPKKLPRVYFSKTLSTCAIADGLVYISEQNGYMNCIDAATGKRYWQDDLRTVIWGSPYCADGKVYLATKDGEIVVYKQGKELKQLGKIDLGEPDLDSTPAVANGVLFVSTATKLYAISEKK